MEYRKWTAVGGLLSACPPAICTVLFLLGRLAVDYHNRGIIYTIDSALKTKPEVIM